MKQNVLAFAFVGVQGAIWRDVRDAVVDGLHGVYYEMGLVGMRHKICVVKAIGI